MSFPLFALIKMSSDSVNELLYLLISGDFMVSVICISGYSGYTDIFLLRNSFVFYRLLDYVDLSNCFNRSVVKLVLDKYGRSLFLFRLSRLTSGSYTEFSLRSVNYMKTIRGSPDKWLATTYNLFSCPQLLQFFKHIILIVNIMNAVSSKLVEAGQHMVIVSIFF